MRHFLNHGVYIHVKIKGKPHKINLGLIITVVIAASVTWFLTEYIVFQIARPHRDQASLSGLSYARPRAAARTPIYHVSPGVDTIQPVRDVIRSVNSAMTEDITVYLREGTYWLTNTLTFDQRDSGTNGYNVIYKAYANERPIISGGRQITGWTLHDAGRNIWKANAAGLDTRQLYVNCVRAIRAHKGSGLPGASKTSTGYRTSDTGMQYWGNPTDIEFVFNGNQGGISGSAAGYWVEFRVGVASISGTTITMKQPAWGNALRRSGILEANVPTDVENAFELLDQPGEWYLNRLQGVIYYIPRSDENMSTAEIIAPVLETLVSGKGVVGSPIHNIQFNGITFAFATWLRPSGNDGLPEHQANAYIPDDEFPLANVTFQTAQALRFERCLFTHLGGMGLRSFKGSQNNVVIGSVFTDISSNGIVIGDNKDPARTDLRTRDSGNQVTNCYIHDVAVEYHGAVGLLAGYVSDLLVSHNEIAYTAYSGISSGWGWGYNDSYMQNNIFNNNYIHHTMRVMSDGGGIYTLNPQPGSKIHNNWFDDAAGSPAGGAIYLDQASANIDIYNNVCSNTKIYWLFINTVDTVTVHDNWTSNPNRVFLRPGTYSTASNTVAISGALSNWPSGAQAVANNAGIESAYSNIKSMTDVCFQSSSFTVLPDRTCLPTAASIADTTGAVWTLGTGSPYPMILRNGVQAGGPAMAPESPHSPSLSLYTKLIRNSYKASSCQWIKVSW
jgi:hypothetical protein